MGVYVCVCERETEREKEKGDRETESDRIEERRGEIEREVSKGQWECQLSV